MGCEVGCGGRRLYIWRNLSLTDDICSNLVVPKDALVDNKGFK